MVTNKSTNDIDVKCLGIRAKVRVRVPFSLSLVFCPLFGQSSRAVFRLGRKEMYIYIRVYTPAIDLGSRPLSWADQTLKKNQIEAKQK